MLNLHFSLLPRWRGAAPVERALLAGDPTTGVCVMELEAGLDTGPLYVCEAVAIGAGETLNELRRRLVGLGSRLLVDLLAGGVEGLPDPQPQEGAPTYAAKIEPSELELHWDRPAVELGRLVRLGRAWTVFRGRRLRVLRAVPLDPPVSDPDPAPGTLLGDRVVTGEGQLRLLEVQPEGKVAMTAGEWQRGVRPEPSERLGDPAP